MSFNLKNEKYHLKNDKKWSCKLISFNLKNEKCHLKNDKKRSCIAELTLYYDDHKIILLHHILHIYVNGYFLFAFLPK